MNRIEFEIAGKRYPYDVPEKWEELTQQQFITFAGGVGSKSAIDHDLTRRILGLDDVVAVSLSLADWWWVCEKLRWMQNFDTYRVGLMDTITLSDGTVCYGFSDNFSDVTWEEWSYADSNANAGRWDVVAAVLYRPQKKDWDHRSDPREPFSQWGADEKLDQMQQLGSDTLAAVALNYKLMRRQLTRRYRRLFNSGEEDGGKKGDANLQSLIRNVMGDNFYEEEKYLRLSVPSVLFQLDRMVREERERRRHARTN